MASNLDTLNEFLKTMNRPNDVTWSHYHDVSHLKSLFASDNGDLPNVGITQRGPQFKNWANIKKLFDKLLTDAFPDMAWTPASTLRMTEGNTIAVEVDVTATQHGEWFQDNFKSHPLSQIDAATIANLASHSKMDIPACMVFTFDGSYKIQQLAIYMDRYKMMEDLAPKGWRKILLPEKKHPVGGAAHVVEYGPAHGKRITITIDE